MNSPQHLYDHDFPRLIAQAQATLQLVPPPSLREILAAYKSNGDGDREMLLAMLNAKAAEDQRLASLASLHRTMLDISQQTSPIVQPNPHRCLPPLDRHYDPPAPATYATYPPVEDLKHRSYRRTRSRSRSPSVVHTRSISHTHSGPERPSKRHRSSHAGPCESSHAYPLSPYSSSERSDTAEYSPRSKSSMTIGHLLSTRPSHEVNGDPSRDRG